MKEKKVKAYYDAFSSNYNDFYKNIQYEKFSQILINRLPDTGWSLDHGGGTGLLSEWLDFPLITLDLSYLMLTRVKQEKLELMRIVADMNHLPFRNASFIFMASFTVLQNSSNILRALNEIWRICMNNAKLVLTILKKKYNRELTERWLNHYCINVKIDSNVSEDVAIISIVAKN